MSSEWFWTKVPPLGGAAGGLASKIFRGIEDLDTSDLLAREVIQNSWDAARKLQESKRKTSIPFQVKFRFVELSGANKEAFIQHSGLRELSDKTSNMKKKAADKASKSFKKILDKKEPLTLLYCEDYGAHGLYGSIDKISKSILFRALYMFGDTNKGEDQGSGGSYGFGKSAFIRGSGIQTVFAYSSFDKFESDPVTRRLVGFSYWDNFSIGEEHFDGRAILGNSKKEPGLPFEDKEADNFANLLHFNKRTSDKPENLGTSLLLVAPLITPMELLGAVEKWWWPALVEQRFEVSVVDKDGKEHFPRPARNPEIKPFLKAFSIARGDSKPSSASKESLISTGWQKSQGINIGDFALRLMDEDEVPEAEENEDGFPKIALMRNPRMVVEYKTYERRRVRVRGVFIASKEADPYLKLSEPAQHDHWDKKPVPDADDEEIKAAAIARIVDDQLRKGLSKFIDEVSPPSPRDRQVLSVFAEMMKGLMGGKKVGPTIRPPASKLPFEIQFTRAASPEVAENGQIRTCSVIQIGLSPNAERDTYSVRTQVEFSIIEEDNDNGENWPITVRVKTRNTDFISDKQWIVGTLSRGKPVELEVVSEPYDPNWTGRIKPRVEEIIKKD